MYALFCTIDFELLSFSFTGFFSFISKKQRFPVIFIRSINKWRPLGLRFLPYCSFFCLPRSPSNKPLKFPAALHATQPQLPLSSRLVHWSSYSGTYSLTRQSNRASRVNTFQIVVNYPIPSSGLTVTVCMFFAYFQLLAKSMDTVKQWVQTTQFGPAESIKPTS